jgi:light-regulated signal transduction histidine kinase (bacteriophytochrome)
VLGTRRSEDVLFFYKEIKKAIKWDGKPESPKREKGNE